MIRDLGLDPAKVNPLGGAIALGHPLGATGAVRTATLVHGLHRRQQKYGMVTMCIGTGMGAAGIFEAVVGASMAAQPRGTLRLTDHATRGIPSRRSGLAAAHAVAAGADRAARPGAVAALHAVLPAWQAHLGARPDGTTSDSLRR